MKLCFFHKNHHRNLQNNAATLWMRMIKSFNDLSVSLRTFGSLSSQKGPDQTRLCSNNASFDFCWNWNSCLISNDSMRKGANKGIIKSKRCQFTINWEEDPFHATSSCRIFMPHLHARQSGHWGIFQGNNASLEASLHGLWWVQLKEIVQI